MLTSKKDFKKPLTSSALEKLLIHIREPYRAFLVENREIILKSHSFFSLLQEQPDLLESSLDVHTLIKSLPSLNPRFYSVVNDTAQTGTAKIAFSLQEEKVSPLFAPPGAEELTIRGVCSHFLYAKAKAAVGQRTVTLAARDLETGF